MKNGRPFKYGVVNTADVNQKNKTLFRINLKKQLFVEQRTPRKSLVLPNVGVVRYSFS